MRPQAGKVGLPFWQNSEREMPDRFNSPNRSAEYRRRAEETRAQADETTDDNKRRTLLEMADTWERMAQWEDKNNPERPGPGSN